MDSKHPFGLYLFKKEQKDIHVFKDLLQLMKTATQGRSSNFAYVESENSLLPHLSLWDNLQLVVGNSTWNEYTQSLKPEFLALTRLITEPEKGARHAENWEKFIISLLKGMMSTGHLLVDMNEDHLSPFLIQTLKKCFLKIAFERKIYLATANSGLWLDCAHTIVFREDYKFVSKELDQELLKRHWAA